MEKIGEYYLHCQLNDDAKKTTVSFKEEIYSFVDRFTFSMSQPGTVLGIYSYADSTLHPMLINQMIKWISRGNFQLLHFLTKIKKFNNLSNKSNGIMHVPGGLIGGIKEQLIISQADQASPRLIYVDNIFELDSGDKSLTKVKNTRVVCHQLKKIAKQLNLSIVVQIPVDKRSIVLNVSELGIDNASFDFLMDTKTDEKFNLSVDVFKNFCLDDLPI